MSNLMHCIFSDKCSGPAVALVADIFAASVTIVVLQVVMLILQSLWLKRLLLLYVVPHVTVEVVPSNIVFATGTAVDVVAAVIFAVCCLPVVLRLLLLLQLLMMWLLLLL